MTQFLSFEIYKFDSIVSFDLLKQTLDTSYDIHLLLILVFYFILIVHHVLWHFQRLSKFDSIKTIKNNNNKILKYLH